MHSKTAHISQHRAAVEHVLKADQRVRLVIAGIAAVGVLAVVIVAATFSSSDERSQPAPIVKGPNYNEVPASTQKSKPRAARPAYFPPVQSPAEGVKVAAPDDHTIRFLPSLDGTSAVSDGRTYSIALIAATSELPTGTKLLTQGKLGSIGYAGMRSRVFAILEDEQQGNKTLLCAMQPDEAQAVQSLYHIGEVVQASGEYMGVLPLAGNPAMPILADCQIASSTDNVVRPAAVDLRHGEASPLPQR